MIRLSYKFVYILDIYTTQPATQNIVKIQVKFVAWSVQPIIKYFKCIKIRLMQHPKSHYNTDQMTKTNIFSSSFQHCFICRPPIPLCRRILRLNTGLLKPWHWQSDGLTTRLDLILRLFSNTNNKLWMMLLYLSE
jgi:hypothetical protein